MNHNLDRLEALGVTRGTASQSEGATLGQWAVLRAAMKYLAIPQVVGSHLRSDGFTGELRVDPRVRLAKRD